MTEKHAERLKDKESLFSVIPEADGEEYITAGTDGSMIPPADTEGEESDRRKNRRYRRKEARLTLCHPKGPILLFSDVQSEEPTKQAIRCSVVRYVREWDSRPGCIVSETVRCGSGNRRTEYPADRAVF
ncbi:MAG: hypothetical protein BWK80_60025 [Desulfobacteraceae bacterium IS3]|nr:MAG: hypothetical protein BWK80_60025 [Desulfobacteraceae bacterium IS3]